MTRIRYVNREGVLVSKSMVAGSEAVVVTINTLTRTMTLDTVSGKNLFSATSTSVAKLKNLAKKELKNIGVVFSDEVRNRNV